MSRYAKIDQDRTNILEWRNLNSPKLLIMPDGSKKLNPKHKDFIDAGWCEEILPLNFTEFQNINTPIILTSTIIYVPTYRTLKRCKEILVEKVENRAIALIDHIDNQSNRYANAEKNLQSRFINKYRLNDTDYFKPMDGISLDGAAFMSEHIKPKLVFEYYIQKIIGIRTDYKRVINNLLTSVACEKFDYLSNWDEAKDLGTINDEFKLDTEAVTVWTNIKQIFTDIFNDPNLQ